jgi:hypothetical protein
VFVKAWVPELAADLQRTLAVTSDTLLRGTDGKLATASDGGLVVVVRGLETFLRFAFESRNSHVPVARHVVK